MGGKSKHSKQEFTSLFSFVYRDEADVFARSAFLTAIEQHLRHHPEDKEKAESYYRTLLRYYIDKLEPFDEWVYDMLIPTYLVTDLLELGFNELEDLLQEAIDKECVDSEEVPDLATVRKRATSPIFDKKKEIMTISQRYQYAVDTWYDDYTEI